jgi:hypothetical protein
MSRRKPILANRLAPEIEKAVLELAIDLLALKWLVPQKSLPGASNPFGGEPCCQRGLVGIIRCRSEVPPNHIAKNAGLLIKWRQWGKRCRAWERTQTQGQY